ncbi:hypothetical protein KFK09_025737 [Dendrobium nobile]|uniref:Uncharacterized protein n=1 Tax=Dendrobium nobile TaxID=94219 RepID=A0A8T3A4M1_DENNO|nr:hypothetical protein KFK09_025737 [Dendrobium nobile]
METLGLTTVSSGHLSSSPSSFSSRAALFGSRRVRRLKVSANFSSSWIGKSFSHGSSQNNVFTVR